MGAIGVAPSHQTPAHPDEIQRDKLSVLGHMASSIAHDISNPLATIAATAHTLLSLSQRESEANGTSHLREDLELIEAEARRAAEILARLLDFARQQPAEWKPVSLVETLRRTVSLARHHLQQHDVFLNSNVTEPEFNRDPGWAWVLGNGNRLQQVLINLIINAQQAISSHRDTGHVWVELRRAASGHAQIIVQDDGPGIPPELHQVIFEAFYTTKPNGQGTGLGLSISAAIVAGHGGHLQTGNRPQGGAQFMITLPVTDPLPTAHTAPSARPLSTGPAEVTRRRVLIIDDEPGIRRSLGRLLTRYGCSTQTASSGEDALAVLEQETFDLVLCDLRMPGLSGETFFDIVRKRFPALAKRIVFLSGDLMREETRAFIERCGCPSLQKPYEITDLIEILQLMWKRDGERGRGARA